MLFGAYASRPNIQGGAKSQPLATVSQEGAKYFTE